MRNNISIIVSVALIVLVSGCIGLTGSETTNTVNTVETTVDTTTNQTVTQSTETETESPTTTQAPTTQAPTTTTTESIHDAEVSFEQSSNGSQYDVSVTIEDMGGAEEIKLESPNENVTIIFEGTHTLFELSEGDTVNAYAIGPDNRIVRIQSYTVGDNSTNTAERLPDPPFDPHPRPNW